MPIIRSQEPELGEEQTAAAVSASPAPAQPGTEEMDILDYAADMAYSAGSGVAAAVKETTDFGHWAMDKADEALGTDLVPPENPIYIPGSEYEAKSAAGAVTKGVTQFLTAFVGAGKFLKPFQWAQKLSKAGKAGEFALGIAQGALADFMAFDPQEGRFSDLLRQAGIQTAVTDYLSADPNDGELEGRFKNALEGAALGILAEPVFMAFRSMKKAVVAGKDGGEEAALKALAEDTDDLDKLIGPAVEEGGQPKPKPIAKPGEKVEVYSEADKRIILKDADENGHVALEPGQKFVVSVRPSESRAPKLVDYERFKEIATKSAKELEDADLSGIFNYERMEAPEHVLGIIDQLAGEARKGWDDGVETHASVMERVARMTDELGQDEGFAIGFRKRMADYASYNDMAAHMVLAKKYVQGMTVQIRDLSKKIVREPESVSKAEEAKLLQLMAHWEDMTTSLKTTQKTAARITSAGRIKTKPIADMDFTEMAAAIDKAGGSKKLKKVAAQMALAEGDTKATGLLLKKLTKSKVFDIHNEYWINSILSGPKTHMVNLMSNTLQAAVMPMDRIVGGAMTGNLGAVKEGLRLYAGLAQYVTDSLKWAGKAALAEDTFLETAAKGTYDAPGHVISTKNLGLKDDTALGMGVNFLGKVFRMPSRLLGAEDEFFKQLNYRAKAHADLTAKAVELGKRGKDAAQFVAESMEKMFTHEGAGRYKPALQYAQEATFTRDLEYGLSKWMQQGSGHVPALRIIMPFIRTPANIVRQVWQRTPVLGNLQRQLKAELAHPDPVVQAAAKGKQAIGGLLWTSAIMMAANGRVTGGGPRDPNLRAQQLESGWQPYSYVIDKPDGTKQYMQISRLDPWAMFFGIAADYVEMGQHAGDQQAEEIALGMMSALVNNIGSKTYLRGAIDAVNVFANPERFMERWAQRQASTYVPFSSLAGQARMETDPAMREVRSILDAIRNRIPGLSKDLPAKHSWITGNPVLYPEKWALLPDMFSPYPVKEQQNSVVLNELARLQHGFTPPLKNLDGVELSGGQYSELLRLHGKVRINGRTMHDALSRLMASPSYDINRTKFDDAPDGLEGPRVRGIRRIMSQYRREAERQLLRNDVTLRTQVNQSNLNTRNAKLGRMERIVPFNQ